MKPLCIRALVALFFFLLSLPIHASSSDKLLAELQQLRGILPPSAAFDQWLQTYGYLPPDFDALPAIPYPQDLLATTRNGKPHAVSAAEWPARRKELAALVEDWLLGHAPPAPGNVRGVIESKKQEEGHEVWLVRLEFGPEHAAKLHCWLWIPPNLKRPAPVYLVDNFRYAEFARDAFNQGSFLICVYHASDPVYHADKKDESADYKDLFGKYDWSEFRRRGWSASRAADWLQTLDFVAKDQMYIGGHSRSAKQALACAAFDERIAGVIASSPGSGGSLQFRFCDQYYYGESAERLTTQFPLWVLPKVRFFAGRENKLPADMHFVYALVAPRPVLMSTAFNDSVESSWGVEQMYQSLAPVWQLLGKRGNLALRYRPGQHHADADTLLAHSQFLTLCSQGQPPADVFPFRPFHPWDYETWAKNNPVPEPPVARPTGPEGTRDLVTWLLGDGPTYEPAKVLLGEGESAEVAKDLRRSGPRPVKCRFGEVNGYFYYPTNEVSSKRGKAVTPRAKLPTIIWLAPLHCSTGFNPLYRTAEPPTTRFPKAGFLVLAFDPIATGSRQEERREFYSRHPHWSLMGQMVLDARHALDAALANPDADPQRVYLVGFGVGGMVATFTAALDTRAAATVSISGFTPFRSDTDSAGTGGIRRWSHLYGWLPRLGQFVGRETNVPVDYPETLSAIAPRRMLVVAPKLDWHNPWANVAEVVGSARNAYAASEATNLQLYTPPGLVEFNSDIQDHVIEFLSAP